LFDPIRANKTFSPVLYAFEDFGKEAIRMPYQTVNPFNGEVLRTFDQHTDQQMEQMLANADRTFREIWSKKPVRDRARISGRQRR
jgi:acyl-CoA reductase-like NAD-dependent aldehyde dehydrogenase